MSSDTDRRRSGLTRQWLSAVVIAALLAANRVFVDVLVPPHMRWWLTAAVAGFASLLTSAWWISRKAGAR